MSGCEKVCRWLFSVSPSLALSIGRTPHLFRSAGGQCFDYTKHHAGLLTIRILCLWFGRCWWPYVHLYSESSQEHIRVIFLLFIGASRIPTRVGLLKGEKEFLDVCEMTFVQRRQVCG